MSTRFHSRPNARLGTGVLALALLAPAAEPALAGVTDQGEEQETDHEGPLEAGPGEAGELTPGQESTGDITDENSPPLSSPGDNSNPNGSEDENGPVEGEGQVPRQEGDGEPMVVPVPPAPAAGQQPAPVSPPAQGMPAPSQAEPAPPPRARVPPVRRKPTESPDKTARRGRSPRAKRAPQAARPAPAPAGSTSPAPAQSASRPTGRVSRSNPASPARTETSGSTYTVRAGDSLWSIASAVLGPHATPAQIAREVHRLWRLNAAAIGTGDPNLLGIGVKLRLH